MKKRAVKLLGIALVLLLTAGMLFVSCQKKEEAAEEEAPIIVGMATDVGGLGDKSFNDGAYNGLLMGKEKLGVDVRVIESKQQTDYVPNLSGLAEDGAKLVFAVGFLMADAILEAAANNPDTYYAGIDIWVDPETAPKNVLGISFNEHEAGYLSGVVAGLMTKDYADASPKLNDANVVGVVLGMFIPPVEKFEVGFIAGVKSVNPTCEVLSVTSGSFVDQAKGKEAALAMIDQGADIIFHAAGLTGLGAINAAKERGVLAIGVDVDQNNVAPDTVLTSAEKKIVQTTYLVVESVVNGTFEGGTNKYFGITEDATGIAPFHDFDAMIPQAVKDKVNQTIAMKTVAGRYVYALGGNEKAAALSGVNTKKVMFWVYTNMGFLSGIAAIVFAGRLNSSSPLAGEGFELDVIAACFIGGASMKGGAGTIIGAIIGGLIMGILNNGMSILGFNIFIQSVIKGLVLIAAVAFDVYSKSKASTRVAK